MRNKINKDPIVLVFMGGLASGSTTAAKFFKNKFNELLKELAEPKKHAWLMEDVLFDKNEVMRENQKKRIKHLCSKEELDIDNLLVEHVAIYDNIIKKFKFKTIPNGFNDFIKLSNEFKILKINLTRYKEELKNNKKLIDELFKNDKAEAVKKLFGYSFDAYRYLKDEKEVEKVLKNILTAIKERKGYLSEFSYLLKKDAFNDLRGKYSKELNEILKIMKKEEEEEKKQQQGCFNIFNSIVVKNHGEEYKNKLEEININSLLKNICYLIENLGNISRLDLKKYINDTFTKFNKIKDKDVNLKRLYGQSKGNVIRLLYGNDYLAEKVVEKVNNFFEPPKDNEKPPKIIVIETVKNREEIRYLKEHFRDVHFIALYSPIEERNKRVLKDALLKEDKYFNFSYRDKKDVALLNTKLLKEDIRRDKKEKLLFEDKVYGQQTEDCLVEADIIMESSNIDSSFGEITYGSDLVYFFNKLLKYFFITKIRGYSYPTVDEIIMSHAYNISLNSGCSRRKVGAVIINKNNKIISSGWNNPPGKIEKCCNREVKKVKERCKKQEEIKKIRRICCRAIKTKDEKVECNHITNGECKTCETDCETCFFNLKKAGSQCPVIKLNFSSYCRAIHAEERVLLLFLNENSHDSSEYTFYTTTQPCYACIKRIIDMGFTKIVYKENYDDPLAKEIRYECRDTRMELKVFEGVTANSLFKYYYRPPIEEA